MNGKGLGLRLRNLRRQKGFTLEVLAIKTRLTKSYLSKLERGVKIPSIASILKITKAFGIQIGHLFGEITNNDSICVVKKNDGKPIVRQGARKGYKYEAIAHKEAPKNHGSVYKSRR